MRFSRTGTRCGFFRFFDGFSRGERDPDVMKLNSIRIVLCGLLFAAASLSAQEAAPSATPESIVLKQFEAIGPLRDVAAELAANCHANIVVAPEIQELQVPGMILRNVSGLSVLRAIAGLGLPVVVRVPDSLAPGEKPVWIVAPAGSDPKNEDRPVSRVFSIRNIDLPVDGDPAVKPPFNDQVDEVRMAIETAVDADAKISGKAPSFPRLRLHAPTRILIVSGPKREVDLAEQVISALGGTSVK